MVISSLNNVESDLETRSLNALLEVFGTACSIEDIASAFCKSNGDVDRAGELLSELQREKSAKTSDMKESVEKSSKTSDIKTSKEKSSMPIVRNVQKSTASVGSVSSFLGKSYMRPSSSSSRLRNSDKPVKIEVPKSVLDASLSNSQELDAAPKKEAFSNKEIEEFIFSMLGDGFKLSMDVIRDVLDSCGYDMKKSIDSLLDFPTKVSKSTTPATANVQEIRPLKNYTLTDGSTTSERQWEEDTEKEKDRENESMDLIKSVFTVREREEEFTGRRLASADVYRSVAKPPSEGSSHVPNYTAIYINTDEESLNVRKDSKHHWSAMKQYYEEATSAFLQGDRERANYLSQEGKKYRTMAQWADEKFAQEHTESTKKNEEEKDFTLNLSRHPLSNTRTLLEAHLKSFAQLPSFENLRVIIGNDASNAKKAQGKGKRQKVLAYLEKHSVKWKEDEADPGCIIIRLDQVDQTKLPQRNHGAAE